MYTSDIRKTSLHFIVALRLQLYNQYNYISNKKWPWKKISQMAYLAGFWITAITSLKLFLRGVPLRSNSNKLIIHSQSPSRLLDIDNFQWLMNNETMCRKERNTSKLMAVLVHSARDHFTERKSIRDTWGSVKSFKDWSIRVIFLLGEPNPETEIGDQLSRQISQEFKENGDLVMGNFKDTYKNLRYKHIMGYKWIVDHCESATFVWKVDDDAFINILAIIQWRSDELNKEDHHGTDANHSMELVDFYCPVYAESKPQRDPSSKWFVPKEIWPLSTYPTYCSGLAYGISVPWIRNILSVSQLITKALWIDDILVTGILTRLVNTMRHETPHVKNIWSYSTFVYDFEKTTFCLDGDLPVNGDVRRRKFGVFGRLHRSRLVRESRCIWDDIISKNGGSVNNK